MSNIIVLNSYPNAAEFIRRDIQNPHNNVKDYVHLASFMHEWKSRFEDIDLIITEAKVNFFSPDHIRGAETATQKKLQVDYPWTATVSFENGARQCIEEVRKRNPHVKVVVFTAYTLDVAKSLFDGINVQVVEMNSSDYLDSLIPLINQLSDTPA